MTDYQQVLDGIARRVRPFIDQGRVADYIPALAVANPRRFGMAVSTLEGQHVAVGDAEVPFSVQSISKVLSLTLVLGRVGERLWQRVGREPSCNPFNSLVQLEVEKGRPRNPFINAGALVVTDLLLAEYPDDPVGALLDLARRLSGNPSTSVDLELAHSERRTSYRNQATAALMKSFGTIEAEVDRLIDVYCQQCAITMTCSDLARSFLFLANHGVIPGSGERILTRSQAKRLGALMLTCGLYDESGDFAFRVGLPGKSGVSGGIVAIIPGLLSVAVFGPALDPAGNSLAGVQALEWFTTDLGVSIF
jgi:glutaminase